MAANKILNLTGSFLSFLNEGFQYNLQVLPDVITSSSLLFAILFQSPPMAVFSAAIVAMSFFHGYLARFLGNVFPNMTETVKYEDRCSGRFPGVSFTRMFNMASNKSFGELTADGWPSYYTSFMGFLIGWIGLLPHIYARELDVSPRRAAAVKGGQILLGVLCVLVAAYRILSECEGYLSTFFGLLVGFLIGAGLVLGAAWLSDRRATNMLGMPLIRDKAEDGKPIYVCERVAKAAE
jgi:hypothetical protein